MASAVTCEPSVLLVGYEGGETSGGTTDLGDTEVLGTPTGLPDAVRKEVARIGRGPRRERGRRRKVARQRRLRIFAMFCS